ncbi:hypothetical protein BCR32DRAFT_275713 [Anaeromyces robustus]|uniref:Uncharacterized protein n=1 Tax=Anaeromyces robustus TaxID=1754192 RepID=A0A1Y1XJZ7_9FUNG|nr:hypothetical protein BCR32DRAFT_275713 [Anaeromyces robustus]|eukprot:ORX86045.1 hypothetical protein BCR32DRAFT_275713 [Anaeromyces robustus]
MTQKPSDVGFINKTKRSNKDYTDITINKNNNRIESTTKKGKRNFEYYYEDPIKYSSLDNASNRAKEIAKEMKHRTTEKEKNKKESSIFGATFIRN